MECSGWEEQGADPSGGGDSDDKGIHKGEGRFFVAPSE